MTYCEIVKLCIECRFFLSYRLKWCELFGQLSSSHIESTEMTVSTKLRLILFILLTIFIMIIPFEFRAGFTFETISLFNLRLFFRVISTKLGEAECNRMNSNPAKYVHCQKSIHIVYRCTAITQNWYSTSRD